MTKAYDNAWGMYVNGDAEYYQKRARAWAEEAELDARTFGPVLNKHPVAREVVAQSQTYAAKNYSRARFCMGLREEDYNG